MKPTVALLLATVALVGAAGTVGAATEQSVGTVSTPESPDDQTETPPWPNNETTTANDTDSDHADSDGTDSEDDTELPGYTETANDDGVSPGQQLAGAVGAQGASVQGELWNRTLSERLANATTTDARADVVADEIDTIETYVDELEGVRSNLTEAWEAGEISEGQYRASLSEFVVRAYSVEHRANRTARAAERLPAGVRERHDVNVTHAWNLSKRAHDLYQFEDEIGQEVANETLSNQSALIGVATDSERANRSRSEE